MTCRVTFLQRYPAADYSAAVVSLEAGTKREIHVNRKLAINRKPLICLSDANSSRSVPVVFF